MYINTVNIYIIKYSHAYLDQRQFVFAAETPGKREGTGKNL